MNVYTIEKKKYYIFAELKTAYPDVFKGCIRGQIFVKRENVNKINYTFARLINDAWKISDGTGLKVDKVFFRKMWFDKTYINVEMPINNDRRGNVKTITKEQAEENHINELPELVYLEKSEMFYDDDGKVIDIEVRGKREANDIYFKVTTISKGFGIENIKNVIINNRGSYKRNVDYIIFSSDQTVGDCQVKRAKYLYLTYQGMLRLLFVSRSPSSLKFVSWATNTLFTAQMGTVSQKTRLAGKLMGVPSKSLKAMCDTSATDISCIYLFTLGKYGDLKKSMVLGGKFRDEDYVYKYGLTNSLSKRNDQHARTLGKIKGVDLHLKKHAYIDPMYTYKAETKVRSFFKDIKAVVPCEKYNELVCFPQEVMKSVKERYTELSELYMGHYRALVGRHETERLTIVASKDLEIKEIIAAKNSTEVELRQTIAETLIDKNSTEAELRQTISTILIDKGNMETELRQLLAIKEAEIFNLKLRNLKKNNTQ